MACITLAGYTKSCDQSLGGIKKIALFEKAGLNIAGMSGLTTGHITYLTVNAGYSGYTYDFLKDNSNWTQAIVGDGIMTTVHWTPNITLVFRRMSTTLRNEILEFSKGDLVAIIQDYNNNYWIIGTDRGLQLVASAGSSSGNKLEELNGETILLAGAESYPAPTILISQASTVDAKIKALFGF